MDSCQLLLSRPWQFDIRIKHNGRRNTYQFEKDGNEEVDNDGKLMSIPFLAYVKEVEKQEPFQ